MFSPGQRQVHQCDLEKILVAPLNILVALWSPASSLVFYCGWWTMASFPHIKRPILRDGMNEHVFCLKTGIDINHGSSRFYAVFLDFCDAFGTLTHVMFQSLEEIHLPQVYIDIVRDVYKDSFIQVICGNQLTEPIPLQLGIQTGCPWSAVNFVLAINRCLQWMHQCAPLDIRSPNPVQGYADDVLVCSRDEDVIKDMLSRTNSFLEWSGLEAKQSKCLL